MHYNNKHHLSKQEKELLKKLTEEQQEFLDKLTQASHEFEIFSAEMEDMKGSVDNMDSQIKEKEPAINNSIVSAHDALTLVQKYFADLNRLNADDELSLLLFKVDTSIDALENNFPTLINPHE